MAITNAEMADAWGDLLGLTPEKVTQLAALLDQWALGGARLATWSRLATDVNLFNNAATAMIFDWYGGNATGGPNGDGLYPLMNSEGEVEMVPSPAKIMAGVSGLDPKGTLASEAELPATGAAGDLWIIDGDAFVWSTSAGVWVNMGPFRGPQGIGGTITDVTLTMGAPGSAPDVVLGGTPEAREIGLTIPAAAAGPTPVISFGDVTSSESGGEGSITLAPESTPEAPVFDAVLPRGGTGNTGANGWTAVEANVVDGARRVKQIVDWIGGTGAKPATGKFIGPAGLVDTAAEATDMRGAGGSGSGDMQGANNLSDLTDNAAARTNLDVYSRAQVDTAIGGRASDAELAALADVVSGMAGASATTDALALKADLVAGKVPESQLPAMGAVSSVAGLTGTISAWDLNGALGVRADFGQQAVALARLTGQVQGMARGVADDFQTPTGVDAAASTNAVRDGSSEKVYAGQAAASAIANNMTGNALPSPQVASANSQYPGSYEAFRAFDGNASAGWSQAVSGVANAYVQRRLAGPSRVLSYAVTSGGSDGYPTAWMLQGSNDGASWNVVDTRSAQVFSSGEAKTFSVTTPGFYLYYRLQFTAVSAYGPVHDLAFTGAAPADMSLRSVAYTASAAPSRAQLMIRARGVSTLTVGTDLKGYVSRDGGTTWTEATLTAGVTTGGFTTFEAASIDLSAQPSGTAIKWRVDTTATKAPEIDAVVLQWSPN